MTRAGIHSLTDPVLHTYTRVHSRPKMGGICNVLVGDNKCKYLQNFGQETQETRPS